MKKKAAKAKPRTPKNPYVSAVMKVFDLAMTSPARDEGYLDVAMTMITPQDGWYDGWSVDEARAVLLAYALNCPEDELRQLVERASAKKKLFTDLEMQWWYTKITGDEPMGDINWGALRRATLSCSSEPDAEPDAE